MKITMTLALFCLQSFAEDKKAKTLLRQLSLHWMK